MEAKNLTCLLLLFLFFIPSLCCYPQAAARKADSLAVYSLVDKADSFFSHALHDSALYYAEMAEAYSRRCNFRRGLAYSLVEKADILIDKPDLAQAALYPPVINSIGLQLKDSLLTAISWMQTAQVKMYANPDTAIILFEKCTKYYFGQHPSKYAALAFNDFGFTWGIKGDLHKKADNLVKAIHIYEMLEPPVYSDWAAAYNNLSTVYYELNQRDKAIEYGEKSIVYRQKAGDISRLALGCCNLSQFYLGVNNEQAVKYQQLCVKYAEQSGNQARIIHSYITSSLMASSRKEPRTALGYELKVIALLENSGDNPVMLARRYIAAGMYMSTLHEDSALTISYFYKSLELSAQTHDKYNLRDAYQQIGIFYKNHGNYQQAYSAYTKHIIYRDSIINDNTKAGIAEIEAKYTTEKKDNEIARLHTAQRIKQLQLEKQDALIAASLLEAQRRKKEIELLSQAKEVQDMKIHQQNEQLEKQQLIARNNAQQLKLAAQEQQLQEKQLKSSRQTRNLLFIGIALLALVGYFIFNRYQLKRKIAEQKALLVVRNNIAKDLHDEIGSALTSIRILSEVSGKNLYKDQVKTSAYLQRITEQSGRMQQGMSDIVWAIRPDNDKLENMVVRMREYIAHTLEPKNIQAVFAIDEDTLSRNIGMQQRRDLLLIFKEAINNAAKYSAATIVQVSLDLCGEDIKMRINDNGRGFDTRQLTSSSGIKNMQHRTAALLGTFSISSAPGRGTTIDIVFPAT